MTPADQALAAAAAMVLASLWSGVSCRSRPVLALQVAALLVACAIWLRWDRSVEGHVLISVTPTHGLTVADLLAIWPVCRAMSLLRRFHARRRIGSVP